MEEQWNWDWIFGVNSLYSTVYLALKCILMNFWLFSNNRRPSVTSGILKLVSLVFRFSCIIFIHLIFLDLWRSNKWTEFYKRLGCLAAASKCILDKRNTYGHFCHRLTLPWFRDSSCKPTLTQQQFELHTVLSNHRADRPLNPPRSYLLFHQQLLTAFLAEKELLHCSIIKTHMSIY